MGNVSGEFTHFWKEKCLIAGTYFPGAVSSDFSVLSFTDTIALGCHGISNAAIALTSDTYILGTVSFSALVFSLVIITVVSGWRDLFSSRNG